MITAAKIALYFTHIWCVVIKYRFVYRKKTPNWTCSVKSIKTTSTAARKSKVTHSKVKSQKAYKTSLSLI